MAMADGTALHFGLLLAGLVDGDRAVTLLTRVATISPIGNVTNLPIHQFRISSWLIFES